MPGRFYTYLHRRADDGAVFYVGKGTGARAHRTTRRSLWWLRVARKHGHTVEILAHWDDEVQALEHEKLLIACFQDMGAPLVNLTLGGEGTSGYRHSKQARRRISEVQRGKPRPEHVRRRISEGHRRSAVSMEQIRRLAAARKGTKHRPDTIEVLRAQARERAPTYADERGRELTAAQWAELLGMSKRAILNRIDAGRYPTGALR